MVNIKENMFDEVTRNELYELVIGKPLNTNQPVEHKMHLKDVTYDIDTIPEQLSWLIKPGCNIYNVICMSYTVSDELEEHTDEDLIPHLREARLPEIYIRKPIETSVYYLDVCESMVGGELIYGDLTIKPKANMCVTFPSQTPHSVTEVTHASRPRLTIVCEKYRLSQTVKQYMEFPWYRDWQLDKKYAGKV